LRGGGGLRLSPEKKGTTRFFYGGTTREIATSGHTVNSSEKGRKNRREKPRAKGKGSERPQISRRKRGPSSSPENTISMQGRIYVLLGWGVKKRDLLYRERRAI